jgi:FAD/FMN-containing dehydrogenase
VAGSRLADRILAFDPAAGVLRAEAGFSLFELNRLFWPRGFCAPVAPGTQFITLGGMVAADVHGKNHHRDGCFGNHVLRLRLRVADGRIVECSRQSEPDLFRATVGGMGLTGHILDVECRLQRIPSPWIRAESERIHDIDRFIEALKEAGPRWPYTMGWIDCLSRGRGMGRGILMRGRWAEAGEAPPRVPRPKGRPRIPFVLPGFVISRPTVRAFNSLYYRSHVPRLRRRLAHPESFFYPLDVIRDWNRLYGRRGFTQYQCILPETAGRGAARRFLELLTQRGGASMLCVIKDCGAEGLGLLSFPKPGISIALDIPIRDDTQGLVDALNELVISEGGRVYLAKDQFTRPEHFRAMEPRLPEWQRIRRLWDPDGRLRSAQSVRLLGDRP